MIKRLAECEHDCGHYAVEGKTFPYPDCHMEAKAMCTECVIGLCPAHIPSHESWHMNMEMEDAKRAAELAAKEEELPDETHPED